MNPRLSLSLSLILALSACGERVPAAPTVGMVTPIRGEATLSREGNSQTALTATRVEQGAELDSGDARASLEHDSGAWILLDQGTRVAATLDAIELRAGRAFVDALGAESITIRVGETELRLGGGALSIALTDAGVRVYGAAGEFSYRAPNGEGRVAQGETLTLGEGEPAVSAATLWDDWTGGLADPSPRTPPAAGAIGVLHGRPLGRLGVARVPLSMRSQEVRVRVDGELARTQVTQTFFNGNEWAAEATYALRLPEGAVVEGVAVDRGSGMVDMHVGELGLSARRPAWIDASSAGARLVYDGPNSVRARVYPVAPSGVVALRVTYSQWLDRSGDMRTYVYPMRDEGEAPLIGELLIDVDLGTAVGGEVRAGLGAVVENGHVMLRGSDHRPRADFVLDMIDPPDAENARAAKIYIYQRDRGASLPDEAQELYDQLRGRESYVAIDLPTEALGEREAEARPPLSLALLVDTSGATDPEQLELARGVVEHVLRQLAPTDEVTLRFGDVASRTPEGEAGQLAPATEEHREALLEALATVRLGGATDLAAMFRGAAEAVAGRPRAAVLYLGDAAPTTGAMDATGIGAAIASVLDAPRFFAFGLGSDAKLDRLERALGRDAITQVTHRRELPRAVLKVLLEAARPTLRNVEIDLGGAVERVFPRGRITAPDGGRLRFFGRLAGDAPTTAHVKGERDGAPFDETIDLVVVRSNVADIRRRWAQARLHELVDADAGREALVSLGLEYELLTPWNAYVDAGYERPTYQLVRGFDRSPGTFLPLASPLEATSGWRRHSASDRAAPAAVRRPERTWVPRVSEVSSGAAEPAAPRGDGGVARAAAARTLRLGARGPNACYERKLLVRPELQGHVAVEVRVAASGEVDDVKLQSSSLEAGDVEACIVQEIRGLRFPEGQGSVTIQHRFNFRAPDRVVGGRRSCSDASQQALSVRRSLWRERLAANAGIHGAVSVYREALRQCELGDFRAKRTLLDLMMQNVSSSDWPQLARRFPAGSAPGRYLRAATLRSLTDLRSILRVRRLFGMDDTSLDWDVFDRLYRRARTPEAKLRLVRRWLAVAPEEMDLRLRLLRLLEETGKLAEARRLAWELREDPLADAALRTALGEFWLRQERPDETRRVFSEIVEHAPYDPWARRRLGDLYRAHGWAQDAYREYRALASLRAGDPEVWLLLARAAADAGRVDEALRLEQDVAEAGGAEADEGDAAVARAWTRVRLARLRRGGELRDAALRRIRRSGALRSPPARFVAITWAHPDDRIELAAAYPDDSDRFGGLTLEAPSHGIATLEEREIEEGAVRLRLRRPEREELRDTVVEVIVVEGLGTEEERISVQEVTLSRTEREVILRISEGAEIVTEPRGGR